MTVEIVEVTASSRRMTVTIPASDIDDQVTVKLRELTRSTSLPGFRKGKVPQKLIEARFRPSVQQEVMQEILHQSTTNAFQNSSDTPISQPEMQNYRQTDARDHEFIFEFDVLPNVEVTDIKGADIFNPVVNITNQDVEDEHAILLDAQHAWKVADRPAQIGDRISADITATGTDNDSQETKPAQFVIGRGDNQAVVDEQIVGLKAGDTTTVTIESKSASEESQDSEPTEDEAIESAESHIFQVVVNQVEEAQPDQLDEQCLAMLGAESNNDERLNELIRLKIERESKKLMRNYLELKIFGHLVEANKFDPPQSLVYQYWINRLTTQGLKPEQAANFLAEYKDSEPMRVQQQIIAEKVKADIIRAELIKHYEITVDPESTEALMRHDSKLYPDPDKAYEIFKGNEAEFSSLAMQLNLHNKLLQEAECEDKSVGIPEMMSIQQEIDEINNKFLSEVKTADLGEDTESHSPKTETDKE